MTKARKSDGEVAVSVETMIIAVICLADLLVTGLLVGSGQFIEGNPIMNFYLEKGLALFVGVKLYFVIIPLAIAEWYRRRNPALVRGLLRATMYAYLAVYGIGFALANGGRTPG